MNNNEKIIRMQYPDRSIHEIEPDNLIHIGRNVYILSYFDRTTYATARTILLEEGGRFYKQPLINYTNGWDSFCRDGIRYGHEVDVNLLQNIIQSKLPTDLYQVTQMLSSNNVEKIAPPTRRTVQSLRYVIYHNLQNGDYYWDEECQELIKGGLSSLKGYDYTIVDVNKLQINNQIKGEYVFAPTNKKDGNGITFEDEYENEQSLEKYLYESNTLTFYLKERDAKKFNLNGNKFNIKFSYYGNAKEADGEYILIPIFDIRNEETKRILDANKKEIENVQIMGKKGGRSIKLYNAQDGARYLLKSPFLDKYIDNYSMNIDFQDSLEHSFNNRNAILYTPELRMELEKKAKERIYFIKENIIVNGIRINVNNIKGINEKIDYLKELRNNIQKSKSVDDYYNSDEGFKK